MKEDIRKLNSEQEKLKKEIKDLKERIKSYELSNEDNEDDAKV